MSNTEDSRGDAIDTGKTVDAPFRTLTPDEIIQFFSAKRIPLECNLCENKQWLILQEEPYSMPTLAFVDDNLSPITQTAVGLVMCNCSNCGNARIFLRDTVRDWVSSKERNSPSEMNDEA